jgi:SAM-dependent methyltransferase
MYTGRHFPSKTAPTPPVPTAELSTQVLGRAASIQEFLFGGFVVSEGIKQALELIGRPLETFHDVLDFGCGSARVLRWFGCYGAIRWFGSDISGEAIEWNRRNLGFGEFAANDMEPPLPFPPASFDLIYAISVVTHISEKLQFAWLAELSRVLRPGGIVMLTVMGEEVAAWRLAPEEFAEYQRRGHFYKKVQEGGLHGLPSFYQDAYHSRAYVMREWARYFEPIAYVRNGPMYLQDLAILEKSPSPKECVDLDLPLGAFWSPLIADAVSPPALKVAGWTFQHRAGPVALQIYLNDEPVASTVATLPTPGVADAFPVFPAARNCGFSTTVPIVKLGQGPHVLKIGVAGKQFPYLATYFFVDPFPKEAPQSEI